MTPQAGELAAFGWIDWLVVVGLFALTTWIGERLAGRPATMREFFLGGRRLPWYAVAGSVISTEISAVTLVALPAVVFGPGGDLTYLQLGIFGSLVARLGVALFLVPAYYEREIYSPYDYMGARLGRGVRGVTTLLFTVGGVLAQGARVYVTALVLEVILVDEFAWIEAHTGIPSLAWSVAVLSAVALAWTLVGGIAIVIWTDTILFLILLLAVVVALWIVIAGLEGGVAEIARAAGSAGKLEVIDASGGFDRPYTLWAALFAVSFSGLGAYGTDQLMAQRLLCCRGVREARRAIVASYAGMLVTVLVGCVGLALHAWYQAHPLGERALELVTEKPDRIFPLFVLENVPLGLKGLILAGIFAAAIGGLDSIMAALAQTTLTAWIGPWRARRGRPFDDRGALAASRALVVGYCLLLAVVAVGCEGLARHYDSLLDLALAMAGYTQGALLAGFLLAFLPLGIDGRGFLWSAPLSLLSVFACAWSDGGAWRDLGGPGSASAWVVLLGIAAAGAAWVARGPRPADPVLAAPWRQASFAAALAAIAALHALDLEVAWPWYVPLGCAFALAFGYLWAGRSPFAGAPEQEGSA